MSSWRKENFRQENDKGNYRDSSRRDASPSPDLLSRRSAVPTSQILSGLLAILARNPETLSIRSLLHQSKLSTTLTNVEILEGILVNTRCKQFRRCFRPEKSSTTDNLFQERLFPMELITLLHLHYVFSVTIPSLFPLQSYDLLPVIGHLDLPELEYPEPMVEQTHIAVRQR